MAPGSPPQSSLLKFIQRQGESSGPVLTLPWPKALRVPKIWKLFLETVVVFIWPGSLNYDVSGLPGLNKFSFTLGALRRKEGLEVWPHCLSLLCRCPAGKQWTPLMVRGPAQAKTNAYCCRQVRESTVRQNQVGVQD